MPTLKRDIKQIITQRNLINNSIYAAFEQGQMKRK